MSFWRRLSTLCDIGCKLFCFGDLSIAGALVELVTGLDCLGQR